jgi:hypothetical protein
MQINPKAVRCVRKWERWRGDAWVMVQRVNTSLKTGFFISRIANREMGRDPGERMAEAWESHCEEVLVVDQGNGAF